MNEEDNLNSKCKRQKTDIPESTKLISAKVQTPSVSINADPVCEAKLVVTKEQTISAALAAVRALGQKKLV